MKRFQKIDTEQNLMVSIVDKLNEIGYTKIQDFNGGDDDFLMIDTRRKEYIWCENGSSFGDDEFMKSYEYCDFQDLITLAEIQYC